MDHVQTFLLVLHCIAVVVFGASTGARQSACADMYPQHGSTSQTGPPPGAIKLSADTFSCSTNISVILQWFAEQGFKGFLCQARLDPKVFATVGRLSARGAVLLTNKCGQEASLTQRNADLKKSVEFVWTAPSFIADHNTSIFIVCTVVQDMHTFWLNVTSARIQYSGSCQDGTSDPSVATPTALTSGTSVATPTALTSGTTVATPTALTSGTSVATPTALTSGTSVATTTALTSGTSVATTTALTSGTSVATRTALTSGTSVATTTALTSGTSVASPTALTSGTSVATTTALTSGTSVATTTALTSSTSVATTTAQTSGTSVATPTSLTSGTSVNSSSLSSTRCPGNLEECNITPGVVFSGAAVGIACVAYYTCIINVLILFYQR
ncbi:uncharacterized protein LOC127837682 isoform X3 [Dreissena polymorpha]|uniref:uncharacterized protein LOC127837682 isoform X2 n=1 Tax=Dreissena polymorpha TaxID=45954 RepID=UPI002264F04C|nr:uncharacterized protein LOC127837682 isoform X2 [Dreissena polymorpha]XP_052220907.1 uncharacterized protein LOC127837682 isoform X3 [Dreissena polymorpha]